MKIFDNVLNKSGKEIELQRLVVALSIILIKSPEYFSNEEMPSAMFTLLVFAASYAGCNVPRSLIYPLALNCSQKVVALRSLLDKDLN